MAFKQVMHGTPPSPSSHAPKSRLGSKGNNVLPGTPKRAPQPKFEFWSCPGCTITNPMANTTCYLCMAPRPSGLFLDSAQALAKETVLQEKKAPALPSTPPPLPDAPTQQAATAGSSWEDVESLFEDMIIQSAGGKILTDDLEDHLVNDLADLDLASNASSDTYKEAEGAVDDFINQFLDDIPPEDVDVVQAEYIARAASKTKSALEEAQAALSKMDSLTPKKEKSFLVGKEEKEEKHVPPPAALVNKRKSSTTYVAADDAGSKAAAARAREEIRARRKQSNAATAAHGADTTIHKVVTRRESVAMQSDLFTLLDKDEKKMSALLKRTRDLIRGKVDASLYYYLCGKLFAHRLGKAIPKIMLIISNKRKQDEFRACHLYTMARKCPHCAKNVFLQEEIKVPPYSFHKWCLRCNTCSKPIANEKEAALQSGKVVHTTCRA